MNNINRINYDSYFEKSKQGLIFENWEYVLDCLYAQNHHILTNFDVSEKELYEKAIEAYGSRSLYISENAYDINGNKLPNSYALIDSEINDLSEFWNIFREIKEQ